MRSAVAAPTYPHGQHRPGPTCEGRDQSARPGVSGHCEWGTRKSWSLQQRNGALLVKHVTPTGARARTEITVLPSDAPANWSSFSLQIALVAAIELADEAVHAATGSDSTRTAVFNALRTVHFERLHDLWVEPRLQDFFKQTHHLFGLSIGWLQLLPLFTLVYGPGHVLVTLAFAIWVYQARRHLFRLLRNVFLCTNALAVLVYEVFPTAPPRLTPDLSFAGQPFRFTDGIFGAVSNFKVGFNEYAAMPSVHVAWALIVGVSVAWMARPLAVRLLALCWPIIMLLTVIVTGNHYVSDALGAVVVVGVAFALAMLLEWRLARGGSSAATCPVAASRPGVVQSGGSSARCTRAE